jgi:hypothetical protein
VRELEYERKRAIKAEEERKAAEAKRKEEESKWYYWPLRIFYKGGYLLVIFIALKIIAR